MLRLPQYEIIASYCNSATPFFVLSTLLLVVDYIKPDWFVFLQTSGDVALLCVYIQLKSMKKTTISCTIGLLMAKQQILT